MKRDAISWDLEHNHLSSLCTSPLLLVVLQLLAASSTMCIYTLLLQNVVYDYPNWVTVLKQNISAIRVPSSARPLARLLLVLLLPAPQLIPKATESELR